MADSILTKVASVTRENSAAVLREWVQLQEQNLSARNALLRPGELQSQSEEFLRVFLEAMKADPGDPDRAEAWAPVREFLSGISRSRARQGFTPTETALFVFSLKQPLFDLLRRNLAAGEIEDALWQTTVVLDRLGLLTTDTFQKGREEIIARQQQELLELSTPVVQLWDGVLALPLIGTLDSARTQVVMESLLQAIVDTESAIAIIDITGVPVVDTLVAQHLLKTIAAARLMGADCIISGIRPQIAQTIVHLGVQIGDVVTKATLADAFALALRRLDRAVVSRGNSEPPVPPAQRKAE